MEQKPHLLKPAPVLVGMMVSGTSSGTILDKFGASATHILLNVDQKSVLFMLFKRLEPVFWLTSRAGDCRACQHWVQVQKPDSLQCILCLQPLSQLARLVLFEFDPDR
eukprot:627903-Rhodomonas_salina.2